MDDPAFLLRLDLPHDADERAVRRAYARELKLIDQEKDATGFQTLRDAYDSALAWARGRAAPRPRDAQDNDASDDAPRETQVGEKLPAIAAAAQCATTDADTQAPQSQQVSPRVPVTVAIDYRTLAAAVLSDVLERCRALAGPDLAADDTGWGRQLRVGLADERLIGIAARDHFESQVARLLAGGWRPGHEALLVAAIGVFQWDEDRRRVLALDEIGVRINAAIEQGIMFTRQEEEEQKRQRELILRLRDPAEPRTHDLIAQADTLETMIARFPEWLTIIVSVHNVERWRELNRQVPGWRRKMAFTARPRVASRSKKRSRLGWVVLFFVVINMLARLGDFAANDHATPAHVTATKAEVTKLLDLGTSQLNAGDIPGAIATFTQILEHDSKNDMAYAARAMAYYLAQDDEHSKQDSDMALAINQQNAVAYRAWGLLAMREGNLEQSQADLTRSIELDPGSDYSYYSRALAYEADHQYKRARTDAQQALKLYASYQDTYLLLARLWQQAGDTGKAAAQAEAAIAAAPKQAWSYLAAARIYAALDRPDAALAALERGIKVIPHIALYLQRAELLPKSDTTARLAAIEAALALDPRSLHALRLRAQLEYDESKYQASIDTLTWSLSIMPPAGLERAVALMSRGIIHANLGQGKAAKADFDATRVAAGNTLAVLSSLCHQLAIRNLELSTALEYCNAALARDATNVSALNSKGIALLRMGRYQKALDAYGSALAAQPALAESLYGRALVRKKLGRARAGEADIQAALAVDPSVADTFASYGIRP